MSNYDIPTMQKIMLPVRISPDLYKKMRDKVNRQKEEDRGYSMNEYLTDLIRRDLEGKK